MRAQLRPTDCSLSGSSVHRILRQEYWSGLPFPSPGDLPDPSPVSPALAGGFFTTGTTWQYNCVCEGEIFLRQIPK